MEEVKDLDYVKVVAHKHVKENVVKLQVLLKTGKKEWITQNLDQENFNPLFLDYIKTCLCQGKTIKSGFHKVQIQYEISGVNGEKVFLIQSTTDSGKSEYDVVSEAILKTHAPKVLAQHLIKVLNKVQGEIYQGQMVQAPLVYQPVMMVPMQQPSRASDLSTNLDWFTE